MPKTVNIEERIKHPPTQWTDVSIGLLQKAHDDKLPQFPFLVLLCIKTFAWNGKTAFPSLETIADRLGMTNKSRIQQVGNALKNLEDLGYIKRNDRRRKPDRFVLQPINSVVKWEALSITQPSEQKKTQKNNKLNNPISSPTVSNGDPDNKNMATANSEFEENIDTKQAHETYRQKVKAKKQATRERRRRRRQRVNPVAEAIRLEAVAVEERMEAEAKHNSERPKRQEAHIEQMKLLHSQDTPSTQNERIEQFYASQTLYYLGLVPTLEQYTNIQWSDFTSWILKHHNHEWLHDLPPSDEALADIKRQLQELQT